MSLHIPRYLAPFHPKQVPHFFTDMLIVGSGLAGLRAALAVDPGLSVLVCTKDSLLQSNSAHAQGGIAAVLDPEDRFEDHVADTLEAGGQLCDRQVVEHVIREAPKRIQELIAWGTQFDRTDDGLDLSREGGHGRDRIAHALGDATGKEVMRAVAARVQQSANVNVWEHTFTVDLLTHDGACRGALVWNPQHGKTLVWAKQTILATGGAGQLFRETTNPDVATADGMAIAYRAGGELRDMEFMQFHPTVLYIAGSSRDLITEAMRGEGPPGGPLRPPLHARIRSPRGAGSPRRGQLGDRQPDGEDPASQRLLDADPSGCRLGADAVPGNRGHLREVRHRHYPRPDPGAARGDYMMGGVTVDMEGRTTVPGLWAPGK